jgi:hypothetical protein
VSDKETIETIHGKRHKYDIVKKPGGLLSGPSFTVYKDGKYLASYNDLREAVARAEREG